MGRKNMEVSVAVLETLGENDEVGEMLTGRIVMTTMAIGEKRNALNVSDEAMDEWGNKEADFSAWFSAALSILVEYKKKYGDAEVGIRDIDIKDRIVVVPSKYSDIN